MKKWNGGRAVLSAVFLILAIAVAGCGKEEAINPTVEVEKEKSFMTRGSSLAMIVENSSSLFFSHKNDIWRLDKTTDQLELLRSLGEEEFTSALWVYNNNLYYNITKQPDASPETDWGLYKMDLETKRESQVAPLTSSPSSIYAAQGYLYIESYNMRSIYKLTEQGEADGQVAEADTIYGLIPEGCTTLNDVMLPSLADQYSYMALSNGESLVLADKDGKNARSVPELPAYSRFVFSEDAVFGIVSEDTRYSCLRVDINTLEVTTVFESEKYPTLMQYRNGCLYYTESDSQTLTGSNTYFYCLNTKTNEKKQAAQIEAMPGTAGFHEFYGNFYVTEDMIYCEAIEDYDVYMSRKAIKGDLEPVLLDTPLYQSDIKKLGAVEAQSVTTPCSCGEKVAAETYVERLVLKDTSAAGEAINNILEENFSSYLSLGQEVNPFDETWIHDESYTVSTLTYQMGPIHYLDDRYLCFQMDGYEYSGGAHGMPYRDIFLFDLKTGERLELSDIVDISETELKTLVSAYFRELSEKTRFSFSSPEELEKEITDSLTMEAPFYMTGEGLVFYYIPYEIAPYAAGFPEVTIPFEKLRMKIEI